MRGSKKKSPAGQAGPLPQRLPGSPAGTDQLFRILVQGVTDYAIFLLDTAGRVSTWNVGAERIKGYRAEEIIGSHFSRFYTEEDRAAGLPERALRIATKTGRFESEGWRVRKDGSGFWASVVVDRIVDADGKPVGFAKVTRDMTERRRAEETLEQTRAALAQAQKMEAVGQLTGGVAHDFNNLLTVITNSLDLLESRLRPDAQTKRIIDSAQRAADRGARLTEQLLAFARRQPLRPNFIILTGSFRGLRRCCGAPVRNPSR